MVKDKTMQQANFERKKDKWDKRKDTERGSARQFAKDDKRSHKEVANQRFKELKALNKTRGTDTKIALFKWTFSGALVAVYAVTMKYIHSGAGSTVDGPTSLAAPGLLTAGLVAALAAVAASSSAYRSKLAREEERAQAATGIKSELERKQGDKEREEQLKKRRIRQLKDFKERMKRRAAEDVKLMQQAKDLARLLRQRREEREAQARQMSQRMDLADNGPADEHGWTQRQYADLRAAVKRYPESWSHAKKQRWDMIASEASHDARGCEAAWVRLEAEAQAMAAGAKAGRKESAAAAAPAMDFGDDLDWLEGSGDGGGSTSFGKDWSDSDDEGEEDEEDAHPERMAVEVEPEHKGTCITLDGIKSMQGCSTVQAEVLHLQLCCVDCKTVSRVYLSGADADASDAKTWCEGCSGLVAVSLRPTLVHQACSTLCYVDCIRCTVTDVLPSVLMTVCEACDAPNVHKQEFVRNRLISGACFKCHAKYTFGANAIRIEQVTPCDPGGGGRSSGSKSGASDDPMDEIAEELRWLRKKAKNDPRQQLIRLGSALPQMGACRHFKKSYKWYRFACCGRAFPCPECHAESGCPAAALGAHACRMICGKCSMEQSYSPARPCEKCGFAMQAKDSKHWDAGAGTRNLATMSTKDAKKFKGGVRQSTSKFKTSSAKADRVGVKAKAIREHEKKFGKDA